jgi:hypothetical protein
MTLRSLLLYYDGHLTIRSKMNVMLCSYPNARTLS